MASDGNLHHLIYSSQQPYKVGIMIFILLIRKQVYLHKSAQDYKNKKWDSTILNVWTTISLNIN